MNHRFSVRALSAFAAAVLAALILTPAVSSSAYPVVSGSISTDPVIPARDKSLRVGNSCQSASYGSAVVGYLVDGRVGYVQCDLWQKRIVPAPGMPQINQSTLRPVIPRQVPKKTHFGSTPQLYIRPIPSRLVPKVKISEPTEFFDVEACRLSEKDLYFPGRPHMASGFPIPPERVPLKGDLVVQLVPVDFKGKRTKTSPSRDFRDATTAIKKFWERQSNFGVNITFRIPKEYIPLPDRVLEYGLSFQYPNFDGRAYQRYVLAAVDASDSQIDFSDVDVVILAHTPKASSADIGAFIAQAGMPGSDLVFKTNEGTVLNTLIQGADSPRDLYNWIHEFGHMLGLTDSGGVGQMGFDVMLNYGIPELTVWNRFLLDALAPGQLHCVNTEEVSTHWIRPIALPGSLLKGVVIPLSDSSAIVVESRRRMGYDAAIGKESEGALVYLVDTTKSGNPGSGPFRVIGPKRMTTRMKWSLDSPLKEKESVAFSGWKITNIESGPFGDVVRVQKLG
jgi:M6 family metalloprotease-like protein